MTSATDGLRQNRLYQSYASQHSGRASTAAATLVYRRDIRPMLAGPPSGPVIDIGCGQGELVRLLVADGYDAEGVDVSPEQVALAKAGGLGRVRQGDFRTILQARPGHFAAVTATDLLEHLPKDEVLTAFDRIVEALLPGGVFVARVPNAVSPFGGRIRHGDFTHETSFTAASVRQLAAVTGFDRVSVASCPPIAHSPASAGRVIVWKAISAMCKVALAAETGVLQGHIVTQNITFAARKGSR